MNIADILPWGGLAALITAAVLVFRLRPEVRSIDTEAWDNMVEAQAKQQDQIAKLSAELMIEQKRRRETVQALYTQIDKMRTDYERRIEMYKTQIINLERRIRELENGPGKG